MKNQEHIIAGLACEVPADNYDELDQEINPAGLGERLRQDNPLKGSSRSYQFYKKKYLLLELIENKNASARHFCVNLACLSAEPEHRRIISWHWLYAAALTGALTALCLFLAIAEIVSVQYCAIAGSLMLTTTLILGLIFIYLLRDEFIFSSHYGNARLFFIENSKPQQQVFDQFFISLQQAIDRAQSTMTVSEKLIEELKMCRRLRDEGIIDDACYTLARSAIFRHKQYKA